jgi:hypothetical protein
MSFVKLVRIVIITGSFSFLCKTHGKLTVFAPVGAPQGFINISQAPAQTNSLIAAASNKEHQIINNKAADNKNDGNKQVLIPLTEIAKNVKNLIEEYTKLRNLAQKRGSENRYDELLKDANALAKEIENASHKYDELRLEQSQKGTVESDEQAKIIQNLTEPFNSLLWRMDQVIAEIKQDDTTMPDRTAYGIAYEVTPPTSKLVTARTQREEAISVKPNLCEDEEESDVKKHQTLQPFKTKGEDLDDIGG